jgi:subtilisin family serine protease
VQATAINGLYRLQGSATDLRVLQPLLSRLPSVSYVENPQPTQLASTSPNDPTYAAGTQWALNGAFGINAPGAWDVTRGSTGVTVAVVDTGIDYNHPDLYQNIWLNQAEIPPSRMKNLTDVDGDGKITFRDLNDPRNQGAGKITDVNHDGRIDAADILAPMVLDAQGNDTGQGGWAYPGNTQDGDTAHPNDFVGWNFLTNTNDPMDNNGHGTAVAGTIGAMGNNGVGISGVDWQVQLMPLELFTGSGGLGPDSIAAALQYAAQHGARISNNSYVSGPSPTLQAAIQNLATWNYGSGQGTGMVFVAAAGNYALNTDNSPVYPASYASPNKLAVAATDVNGNLVGFSDYGAKTVEVAAPGNDIYSTMPNNGYGLDSGTSFASPQVAGVAALVLAQNPTWSASQVVSRIIATAMPLPSLAGKTVSGGLVNAAAAVGASTTQTTTIVNLAHSFNRMGIVTDGSTYPPWASLDTTGRSLSANLLGPSLTWNGVPFSFGAPNTPNVVAAGSQAIPLPAGSYSKLSFLATSAFGSYTNMTFTVTYTDGTTQPFVQSASEWIIPHNFPGESTVLTMPYLDRNTGIRDNETAYLYAYQFPLDASRQVQSITLPFQPKFTVLAMTLGGGVSNAVAGPPAVSLATSFNRTGMTTNGSTFTGGLDGAGHALSATLLGSSLNWNGVSISLGAANAANVVSAAGQVIALPAGRYSVLSLVATGVNGNQTNQTFTVTYTDGSTQTITQSISDWLQPAGFAGESVVATLPYRDNANGTQDAHAVSVYGYRLVLDASKQVKSITLPSNSNVEVLGMGLAPAAPLAVGVPLAGAFNRTGISKDGVGFSGGGLDGNGHSYSNSAIRTFIAYNGRSFGLGIPGETNALDVVSAAGQVIALPAGRYSVLSLIATGVNGSQTNQTFTVTYTDGTTQTITQSLSDWKTPANFAGESVVAFMRSSNSANGANDSSTWVFAYGYRFALDASKQVKSITLPANSNVAVLAIGVG